MNTRKLIGFLLGACLWLTTASASAQTPPIVKLNYQQALEMARQSAPALQVARARATEASSEVEAARVRTFNPQLLGAAGPRLGPNGTTPELSIGFRQWMELGGQRGDRVDAAEAGAEAGRARRDDAERILLREVGLAFVDALYWQQSLQVARENLEVSQGIARVATKRHELGDGSGLDLSMSELALARARAMVERNEVALATAEGRLKGLLGLDPASELACAGTLESLTLKDRAPTRLEERADLRALQADGRRARAETELGHARRIPNLALGATYSREESSNIVQGTLILSLPVADRGQGLAAQARARGERIDAELDAARRTAAVEIDTAQAAARELSTAADRFRREGLEAGAQAQEKATAAYESGSIAMGELLALRREVLAASFDYLELLAAAARARVELDASVGDQP